MNRAHWRASRSNRAGGGLVLALLAGVAGCSWNENTFNPDAAPLSVSISLPDGRDSFQINESIPLDVILNVPAGQGRPHTMTVKLMRGNVIMGEQRAPDAPTRHDGTEQVYRVEFDEGLSKPGKHQAHATAFLQWPGPAKQGRGWPKTESEPIAIEVTK